MFRFFDNVGGPILDEVLVHMNPHGVVGLCGAMAGTYCACLTS